MRVREARLQSHIVLLTAAALLVGLLVLGISHTVKDPWPIYGFLYLFGFMALAWTSPQTALLVTFAAGPFQNDVSGNVGPFRFSVVEVNLLVLVIVFALWAALGRVVLKFGPVLLPVLLYLGLCIASTLPSWSNSSALPALMQITLYLVITVVLYASFVEDPKQYDKACLALIGVCLFLCALVFMNGTAYVMGLHKNGVGSSLACGVIICTELFFAAKDRHRKWWLGGALLILVSGLVFTLSRGAWMGTVVGIFAILLVRRQLRLLITTLLVMLPVALILWNALPEEKRESAANFDTSSDNIHLRLATIDTAWKVFRENPIQGVGVGLRKEVDATNVIFIVLGETGLPGLCAFLLIHLQVARMTWMMQRTLPRTDPRFSILVISMALVSYKLAHGTVDHYWSRGSLSIVWASVGVTTGLYYSVRKQNKMQSRPALLSPTRVEAAP